MRAFKRRLLLGHRTEQFVLKALFMVLGGSVALLAERTLSSGVPILEYSVRSIEETAYSKNLSADPPCTTNTANLAFYSVRLRNPAHEEPLRSILLHVSVPKKSAATIVQPLQWVSADTNLSTVADSEDPGEWCDKKPRSRSAVIDTLLPKVHGNLLVVQSSSAPRPMISAEPVPGSLTSFRLRRAGVMTFLVNNGTPILLAIALFSLAVTAYLIVTVNSGKASGE